MGDIDPAAWAALVERARREIDQGLLPSCQLAMGYGGDIVEQVTLGDATDDTRYVIFSCTKAPVAAAVWQVLGEGAIALDDRVVDHIPEFDTNGKDVVTVEQVLLHTSGFPRAPMGPNRWTTREGRLEAFGRWRLNWEPGTRYEYHPSSAHWVLAELLEHSDGIDFRESVRRRIMEPLGLKTMALGVAPEDGDDIAIISHVGQEATADELEAVLGIRVYDVGEVTDEAVESFNQADVRSVGVPGGGAVSTAADLARFYQALLHNPAAVWDADWLRQGTTVVRNHFPDPITRAPANRTIGLVVAGDDGRSNIRGLGRTVSPRAFGHGGAGGQIGWADPDRGLSFAYLTNGHDRHLLRQARRGVALSSLAAVCASPDRGEGRSR